MRFVNLAGQRFERLTVLERDCSDNTGRKAHWICRCDCGNYLIAPSHHLKSGAIKSCGCYSKDINKEIHTSHGMRHTRLYKCWCNTKERCFSINNKSYKDYGGRGITVCEEWQKFEPFYEWAMANGYRDDLTLDRIDANGNYEPSNCRWATKKEQGNNKRNNCCITYNGEMHTISEWADIVGMPRNALYLRLKRGWDVKKALEHPLKK